MTISWDSHYQNFDKKNHPPASTLQDALNIYSKFFIQAEHKVAVDLGCGNGIDTFALLNDNWNVIAIDKENEALLRIKELTPNVCDEKLELRLDTFENINKLPTCKLINATFSLPFCNPHNFDKLWQTITTSITTKGVFCGHFFGVNDSWFPNIEMTFHTKQQVLKLLENFDVNYCKEIEKSGKTISGVEKYWHVFHVVAQKK